MAYTRIHAIKATVDKSIAYIRNPDKTDENYMSPLSVVLLRLHIWNLLLLMGKI